MPIGSHDVAVATTADDALALVASRPFDIIFCDVMMPGINGHELYRRVAAQHPGLERRFVFMTGALAPGVARALESLPNPSLAKPFEIEDVLALIAASDAASRYRSPRERQRGCKSNTTATTARTHGARPVGIPPHTERQAYIEIQCRRLSSDASQSHQEGEVATTRAVFVN